MASSVPSSPSSGLLACFLRNGTSKWANSVLPLATLATILILQAALIFAKSFNWDEFLHYSQVYQLRTATLSFPFQVLHSRLLYWVPEMSDDLIVQMQIARLFVWIFFFVGLASIYGLARQFIGREGGLWAVLAYLSSSFVFAHGFAIRADPMAMGTLIFALYLLATRPLDWKLTLMIGSLVGLAGMMTLKSVFYTPCFLGIAWLRLSDATSRKQAAILMASAIPVAIVTFALLSVYHRAGLAPIPERLQNSNIAGTYSQWLNDGIFRQPQFTVRAFVTAPLIVAGLALVPVAWRATKLRSAQKIALASFLLPLVTIMFYRNVFPYYFVFVFAPVAVAIAPSIAWIRKRYGGGLLAIAVIALPVFKFVAEPRDVLDRQEALINYIHSEYPAGTRYLDYCGMIADYPRVLDHLTSGIGMRSYYRRGAPVVGKAIDDGEIPFIIGNQVTISAALQGYPLTESWLPQDLAAMQGNYVRFWGNLWLAGKAVEAGVEPFAIDIGKAANYTWSGGIVAIDGQIMSHGETIFLAPGTHMITGVREAPATLWQSDDLPSPPPPVPDGRIFTNF